MIVGVPRAIQTNENRVAVVAVGAEAFGPSLADVESVL
jgi:alanine dehydrogenase